jgi:hypothetical protein
MHLTEEERQILDGAFGEPVVVLDNVLPDFPPSPFVLVSISRSEAKICDQKGRREA